MRKFYSGQINFCEEIMNFQKWQKKEKKYDCQQNKIQNEGNCNSIWLLLIKLLKEPGRLIISPAEFPQ